MAAATQAVMPDQVCDVTLSGSSALLPGSADSCQAFAIASGSAQDLIGEVPAARWDVAALPAGSCDGPSLNRRRHGGFVGGAELFEPAFFAVSVAEASAMDPQQRLLLERGFDALHAGGLTRAALSSSLVGVFVGVASTDFMLSLIHISEPTRPY